MYLYTPKPAYGRLWDFFKLSFFSLPQEEEKTKQMYFKYFISKCTNYIYIYIYIYIIHTVYDRIEAWAFISYKSFLTRRLNETGINLAPGVYFLLATRQVPVQVPTKYEIHSPSRT